MNASNSRGHYARVPEEEAAALPKRLSAPPIHALWPLCTGTYPEEEAAYLIAKPAMNENKIESLRQITVRHFAMATFVRHVSDACLVFVRALMRRRRARVYLLFVRALIQVEKAKGRLEL